MYVWAVMLRQEQHFSRNWEGKSRKKNKSEFIKILWLVKCIKERKGTSEKNCHVVFVGGCDGSGCRVSQVCSSNPFISLPVSLGIHTNPNWRRNRTHYITNEWWWWLLWRRRYESKNVFLLTCKNNVHPVYINILKLLHFSRKVSSYMAS